MNYHLEVLNDKEFEDLCKDLLEAELRISLQIFKSGADKGIDIRYASNIENEIIVQAKHFPNSKFSDLKTQLKDEKVKMGKLVPAPQRYILMTTLPLSVGQVDEIVNSMYPYIQSSQDVYGKNRIMSMIAKYDFIEKKYYKLWLTSTKILNRILHNGTKGRSEFFEKKILEKVSLYVPTQNYKAAVDKLKENHFIIVSGEPGIGKTTISYLLICDLLGQDYELIYVDDTLKDAEELLSNNPEHKQVVFFDDFFGANLSEIINPRNSESKIVSFIERIKSTPNKFLVLTTRTTILNQAQHSFEKFKRSGLADVSKYEIKIKAYSKLDKAKILYNHLYHSGMSTEQYDVFFQSLNYLKIIEHDNYFPRLIEFITSIKQLTKIPPVETEAFIFRSLDNPSEIWQFAYDQQLTPEDQMLLTTLFSLGGYNVSGFLLESAFENRYQYEIKNNGFKLKTDAYNQSLKKLMTGFITCTKHVASDSVSFSFLNPSIGDFMLNYLKERHGEQKRILYSVKFFKQITKYFSSTINIRTTIPRKHLKDFFIRFNELLPEIQSVNFSESAKFVSALYVYLDFFSDLVDDATLLPILKKIDFTEVDSVDTSELYYVLEYLAFYDECKAFIIDNWNHIFTELIEASDDAYEIARILEALEPHVPKSSWISDIVFLKRLEDKVNSLFQSIVSDPDLYSIQDEISDAYFSGYHSDAVDIVRKKLDEDYSSFLDECGLADLHDQLISTVDFDEERVTEQFVKNIGPDDDYEPGIRTSTEVSFDENREIQRLFER